MYFLRKSKFNQCYTVNIAQGESISGKAEVTSKSAKIELNTGTPPFTVYLNGIVKINTLNTNFELEIEQGDLIEVKSSIVCEGVFSKKIDLINNISIYPNPITTEINFNFPNETTELNFAIYSILGNIIFEDTVHKSNPKVNISFLTNGLYFFQVQYDNEIETFKILKN